MVRARLASVAMAGSLLLSAGCSTSLDFLHPGRSRTMSCPVGCDSCDTVGFAGPCCPTPGCATGGFDTVPLISNAHPSIVEGPALFPPSPTPLPFPGPFPGAMPPAMAPRVSPLPPVVSVPQATPSPSPP
jgi:hypothetical protein